MGKGPNENTFGFSNIYHKKIFSVMSSIYPDQQALEATEEILNLIRNYGYDKSMEESFLSEKDVLLITYGDSLKRDNEKPLKTLYDFYIKDLKDAFSFIHILPFFPYSSDDGFSVIDYKKVNPELGDWPDIEHFNSHCKLMFDFVLNHISSKSRWFKRYLNQENGFADLAIEVDPNEDVSMVFRPRALPLLTPFKKKDGSEVYVWTTFSSDQIDLNYKSIDVLIRMMDVLLFYVKKGASMIRLDAIAYLWKEIGTSCIHLKQAHLFVKLMRIITEAVKKECIILTETNVPHKDNILYFGNGNDEAHMIYNFTLPPVVLYTFLTENTDILNKWAQTLVTPSEKTTFLNFTASHDGIGVLPLKEFISESEFNNLIEHIKRNGGYVSYKTDKDKKIPYELNISYVDAIRSENDTPEKLAKKFVASQSISVVLPGVPALYIHSILGSRNFYKGVKLTGKPRSINREKLNMDKVACELSDKNSFRSRIFYPLKEILDTRRKHSAFHPNAEFEILWVHPGVFAIKRFNKKQTIYAFTNVSEKQVDFDLPSNTDKENFICILGQNNINRSKLSLMPYEVCWFSKVY